MSKSVARYAMLGVLLIVASAWWRWSSTKLETAATTPQIVKRAATVTMHTFDPLAPPRDMPPLSGMEAAVTDSNFISDASFAGESERNDATHATVTVTGVKMTLNLNIDIWLPAGASQQVLDHEQGHRQISEYYYRDADTLAKRMAVGYIGQKFSVSGADVDTEAKKLLQKLGSDVTSEYSERLNPNAAQQRYDDITDHSRYDIAASDAVARTLKEMPLVN